MKLFEYEAKDLLRRNGILVPSGYVDYNPDEAEEIARGLGRAVVVKSQVLVSGRGKSGGIQFASDATEARSIASDLIGNTIKGNRVDTLLVEEKLEIVEQFYASVTIDRYARTYVVLASTSGGVDIEEVAQTNPGAILRYWVDPEVGFSMPDALEMLMPFSMNDNDRSKFASVVSILYRVAIEHDAELVEVNPADASALGIADGDMVKVASRRGEVVAKAMVTEASPIGVVSMDFHFAESPANIFTNPALDPVSKIPEFKVCAVRVEKNGHK